MVTAFFDRAAAFGQSLRSPAQTLNKSQSVRETQAGLQTRYDFWRAVYGNEAYGDLSAAQQFGGVWTGYPKSLRPISLIAKVAVDWWPRQVYAGVWTKDGLPPGSGDSNLIPYSADTDEDLRLCVQQAYAWAGAKDFLRGLVKKGAMLGDVFAEVEVHYNEDGIPQSNKVFPVLHDPAHLVELSLNARGDVKSYRLAIPRYDETTRRQYLWGKLVTKTTITTYYDDDEYSYIDGQPASIPNRWGFVPAVWTKYQDADGQHGAPLADVIVGTIAEYDAGLSAVNDFIHRFVRQGVLLATKDPKGAQAYLLGQQAVSRNGVTDDYATRLAGTYADRQTMNVWPVPDDVKPYHLLQDLGLAASEAHINRIRMEIEEALPEIVFIRRLQGMQQTTGPGARALMTEMRSKLNDVAGNFDHGVMKLGQMCAAIGGQLISDGDWGLRSQLTPQQQKFLPFDLTSYQRNELDFDLQPRELLPKTRSELLDEAIKQETITTPAGLRHVGYSDAEIYGVDANGKPLAPEPRPGILQDVGSGTSEVAATVGDALQRALNSTGVTR